LDEIILTEKLPANFTMTSVIPQPKKRGNVLMWNFGFMAPGQKEIITITGKARSGPQCFEKSPERTGKGQKSHDKSCSRLSQCKSEGVRI
jgi:hypothetical protein